MSLRTQPRRSRSRPLPQLHQRGWRRLGWIVGFVFATAAAGEEYARMAPASDLGAEPPPPASRPVRTRAGDPAPVREAIRHAETGDLAGAIARLEEEVRASPEHLRAWEILGLLYWQAGHADRAEAIWKTCRSVFGDRPEPHKWLGELTAALGRLPEAAAHYERALAIAPHDLDARFQRVRITRWMGRVEEALEEIRALCAEHPGRADVRRELAAALFAHRDYAEAARLWSEVRRDRPDDPETAIRAACARVHATGDESAVAELRAWLEQHPNHLLAARTLALAARRRRDTVEALCVTRRLMDIELTANARRRAAFRCVEYLSTLAARERNPARHDESLAILRASLERDGPDPDVELLLAETLIEARRFAEARDAALAVLDRHNRANLRAQRVLFEAHLGLQQPAEAGRWLARIAAFNPRDPYVAYYEARRYIAAESYTDAIAALDRLEAAGRRGAVAVLLYHGLGESEWSEVPSVAILTRHIAALREAGYRFVAAHELRALLEGGGATAEGRMRRIVCITWDDARRDAIRYGTPLSVQLDVTMTMHVPVGFVNEHHPFIADWPTLEFAQRNGRWHFGSHALEAHRPAAVDASGITGSPLANRVWMAARGRLESIEEYRQRLVREYRESRQALVTHLRRPEEASVIAYPFGDIGQLGRSNVEEAPALTLEIAALYYKAGFVQSAFGYAVAGDNPLLYQRTEPEFNEDSSNLVARLLTRHPLMLARAMKAEVAAMAGRMYLARDMLLQLANDGYPVDRWRDVRARVERHLGRSLIEWLPPEPPPYVPEAPPSPPPPPPPRGAPASPQESAAPRAPTATAPAPPTPEPDAPGGLRAETDRVF